MSGRTSLCSSLTAKASRQPLPVYRRIIFQKPVSCGAIRSTIGQNTRKPDMHGGSPVSVSSCSLWTICVLIISVVLKLTGLYRMATKQLSTANGSKARGLPFSAQSRRNSAKTFRFLQKISCDHPQTSCLIPNKRSSLSFSLMNGMESSTPGMLTPLRLRSSVIPSISRV